MIRLRRTETPSTESDVIALDLDGDAVGVRLRRHAAARRMTLRIPPGEAAPVLTLPPNASRRAAERFLRQNVDWLHRQLTARMPPRPFVPGARIPVRGTLHVVRHVDGARGTAWLARDGEAEADGEPVLFVAGREEHVHRRVADALRKWAREDLVAAVDEFARMVDRKPVAVRVKDTRSQWGSCTSRGVLSFSWRLVLAPPNVLRYVAAHEVAHLVHMDHGPDFWRLNARLSPDLEEARGWLKANGRALHAFGARPPDGTDG